MTHYAIIGRAHGDDEDTCLLIDAETVQEACYQFYNLIREAAGISDADLATGEEWTNVYITHAVSCDRPLTYENKLF